MRFLRLAAGCLIASSLGAASAEAARVSLFNGLPDRIEVVRILEGGGEHRPWAGPMEPGSRWRLSLPEGTRVEFRRKGVTVAVLRVGPEPRQGHVVRLPGVDGPVPPPPPAGQPSEFPGWRDSTAVQPVVRTASLRQTALARR